MFKQTQWVCPTPLLHCSVLDFMCFRVYRYFVILWCWWCWYFRSGQFKTLQKLYKRNITIGLGTGITLTILYTRIVLWYKTFMVRNSLGLEGLASIFDSRS